MDIVYKGEKLRYIEDFHGEPVLWITESSQTDMEHMTFVGGHPDEYCIFLKDLTADEQEAVIKQTAVSGKSESEKSKSEKSESELSGSEKSGIGKSESEISVSEPRVSGNRYWNLFRDNAERFLVYCFGGWLYESVWCCVIVHHRGFINRGFLFGPWLPIYGIGAFIILGIFALLKIKKPVIVFLAGAVIATIAELTASYIIDMTIGVPMWDYTNEFLNFDSRIALVPSLMFGLLIWAAVCLVQPLIIKVQEKIRDATAHNVVFIIIVLLFLADLVSRIWLGSNCVG